MDNPEREDGTLVLVADQILAQKLDESGELRCIVLGGRVLDGLRSRKVLSLAKFGCLRHHVRFLLFNFAL